MKNDSSPPSINDMQAAKKEAAETDAPAEGAAASTDLESRSGAKDGIGPAETAGENPPSSDSAPQTAAATTATGPDSGEIGADGKEGAAAAGGGDGTATGEGSGAALEKMIAERQERAFAAAKEELEKAIEKASANDPGLADAAKSLQIDSVAQGLRVQLVDQEKVAFFPNGSADMLMSTRTLLAKVSEIIGKMPNKIRFQGTPTRPNSHLARPIPTGNFRPIGPWPVDALIAGGITAERIVEVVGRADREPILPDQPASPTNRRISIVLLRQTGDDAAAVTAARAELAARPSATNWIDLI